MSLLKVRNINKQGPADFVLKDISFSQRIGENVAIAGETGAGKSTLLKLIAGLLQPDSGELVFQNKRVIGPKDQLVPGHPGIAYLSQHFELPKSLRVEQVLDYSNTFTDVAAQKLYAVCQIDHLLKRRTDELSGGEKQRVAICRLLTSSPGLLLLDEPFSHLDMVHKNTLKKVIRDIGEELRITCILVSHDPLDILSWADKILVMKEGTIVQKASPEVVYLRPTNAYVAGLFGKFNLIGTEDQEAFSVLSHVKGHLDKIKNEKKIFLRPEQVRIVKKSKRALRGKIRRVLYFGSYVELEVLIGKRMITVRSADGGVRKIGETIYLSIANDALVSIRI